MKTFTVVWIINLLLLFSMSGISYGQSDSLCFEQLLTQKDLSHSSVWAICQDSEGFMWFGTLDGLNKYDGYNFTVFKPDPNDPEHSFQHNMISDIHEDRTGRLWVTTFGGGLHEVDKRTGKVTPYRIDPSRINMWNVMWNIHEDQKGILWIGSRRGIARFDPQTKQYSLYPSPAKGSVGSVIYSLTEDASGRLWAGSEGAIYEFDRSSGKFIPFPLEGSLTDTPIQGKALFIDSNHVLWIGTEQKGLFQVDLQSNPMQIKPYNPNGLINKNIWLNGISEDAHGILWVATNEGLQIIDKKTEKVVTYQASPSLPASLNSNIVQCIYQDRNSSFWIGTNMGINTVVAHSKKFHTYQIKSTLPDFRRNENYINTLLEDQTGMIWLGSAGNIVQGSFQNGLFQIDPTSKQIKRIPADPHDPHSLSSNQVWAIHEDKLARLWIGTTEGLHQLDPTTGKFTRYPSDVPASFIDEDPQGKLWLGGYGWFVGQGESKSAIASFDPQTGKYFYYTYNPEDTTGLNDVNLSGILASRTGDIWINTGGGGINRLNPKTGKFTYYTPDYVNPEGHLKDKDVRVLFEDSKGIIWAGTNHGGLHRLDPATEIFTYFTTREGLPSNQIVSINEDEKGNLWISTNQGLSRFNPETNSFRNFDISDGLPDNVFTKAKFYSRDGRLMLGTRNGFVIFHPDSIKDNTTAPPVYITGLKVLEKSRNIPTDQIELPYDENFLSFEFVALNYDAPEKNQYAYKLEGVDKDWVYSGTRRFASYTDVDPGEYTFRVKASNNDGVWNERGVSLKIFISPPWWRTSWAYSLYGLFVLALLYSSYRYVIARERLKHDLKLKHLEAEKLQEIDGVKTRFFTNISHEFRTPLTLILGPVQYMLSHVVEEWQVRKNHQLIYTNAHRLLELINQLLDISKIEAGNMPLKVQKADIVKKLRVMIHSFASLAESRQVTLSFTSSQESIITCFDKDKLEKMINNLVSNAFKFTPQGGSIAVKVSTASKAGKNKSYFSTEFIEITVTDTGIGIEEERLDKIFDRFYQTDASHTREEEGTGIGLALVKELVELHQGEITVESKVGKGTTFTILLPVINEQPEQEQLLEDPTEEESLQEQAEEVNSLLLNANIEQPDEKEDIEQKQEQLPLLLIVEDNPAVSTYIKDTFTESYSVIEARDGKEGLHLAIEHIPNLVITDLMMPKMDGLTLCDKLKRDERTSHIPLILLTAKANVESKLEGLQTGADDYVTKPFHTEELLVRVKNLIEGRKKLRERYSRELTLQPSAIAVSSADERFLEKAFAIMEANISNVEFNVDAFSREICMSRVQLHRKLTALTDQSPSEFIRSFRLKRAAMLLSQHYGNVSEVAFSVGFNSLTHFGKCFREQYGQTPSEYLTHQSTNTQSSL